jgi:hypothetical protein
MPSRSARNTDPDESAALEAYPQLRTGSLLA